MRSLTVVCYAADSLEDGEREGEEPMNQRWLPIVCAAALVAMGVPGLASAAQGHPLSARGIRIQSQAENQMRHQFQVCRTLLPRWAAVVASLRKETRIFWSPTTATSAEWKMYKQRRKKGTVTDTSRIPWTAQRLQAWRLSQRAMVICARPFTLHFSAKEQGAYTSATLTNDIPTAEWTEFGDIGLAVSACTENMYIDFADDWAQLPYPTDHWPRPLGKHELALADQQAAFTRQRAKDALVAMAVFERRWHLKITVQ